MTRVAVIEPFPRVSGVTAYTWHAAAGFEEAGCDVDVVTFTRSGKAKAHSDVSVAPKGGWQWWSQEIDVTARWADAPALLNSYDLVVINEAKCLPLDKDALRRMEGGDMNAARKRVRDGVMEFEELPLYARALADVTKPWVGILHAPQYQFTKAPMLGRFLRNVPQGLLVHHKPGALESAEWAGAGEHRELFLPYLPYRAVGDGKRDHWPRVVGTTGRFITNKGQPHLIAAATTDEWPEGWDAEVWGAGPAGAGANHTFLAYEGLVAQLGWEGQRDGKPGAPRDAIGNAGDVLSAWPWAAHRKPLGRGVTYRGGYTVADSAAVYASFGAYANFTDPAFCGKGNEYTHLEAMDHGCVPVVQPACLPRDGDYAGFVQEPFPGPVTLGGTRGASFFQREGELELAQESARIISSAAALIQAGEAGEIAAENYEAIRSLNSPRAYAEAVLGAAL